MIKTFDGKDFKQELINDYVYYKALLYASYKNSDTKGKIYERTLLIIKDYYRRLYGIDIETSINIQSFFDLIILAVQVFPQLKLEN